MFRVKEETFLKKQVANQRQHAHRCNDTKWRTSASLVPVDRKRQQAGRK